MKWAHLPVAGGLYDQDPRLIDSFKTIFGARAKKETLKREEEERRNRTNNAKSSRVAGRRH